LGGDQAPLGGVELLADTRGQLVELRIAHHGGEATPAPTRGGSVGGVAPPDATEPAPAARLAVAFAHHERRGPLAAHADDGAVPAHQGPASGHAALLPDG